MRRPSWLTVAVVVAGGVLLSRAGLSEEKSAEPAAADDAESQIEKMVRYAMPGREHKLLDRMAGRWTTATRYWMAPGMPAVDAEGTCQRRWVLGRRFLMEEFDGGNLALPFQGIGLYGYDAFESKYTSSWADTMSTAIMHNLGVYDPDADEVNFVGRYGDPWTGVKKPSRGVTRFVDEDTHVLEMYVPGPDGEEFKTLEITYKRAAPAKTTSPAK